MIIEQLLKEWVAERSAAADLAVAARSAKSIAAEIDSYFNDLIARAEAAALERSQALAEKERSLDKSLDVIAKLEAQLAQLRDRSERSMAEKDRIIGEKDGAAEQALQSVARLTDQFNGIRERLEARLQAVEKDLAEKSKSLAQREDTLAATLKDLQEKVRLIETYREKFGVIMKAVG